VIRPPSHAARPVFLFFLLTVLVCAAHASPPNLVESDADPDGAARTDTTYAFYTGVFHSHTSYSDGVGTPAEAFAYARDAAGIDFLAVSDHHNQLDADEYANVLLMADAHTEDGVFVALAAQEWTGTDPVTGLGNHAVVLDADHVFTAAEDDVGAFYAELVASERFAILAHPAEGSFDDFDYIEGADAWIAATEVRGDFYQARYAEILRKGWRVGTAGGQDTHDGTWGDGERWTVALAPALTKADILDAVASHRTYATTDRNLELTFRIDGHWMGEEFDHDGNVAPEITVLDRDPGDRLARVELYQNGCLAHWQPVHGTSWNWSPELTPPAGLNHYFVKAIEADGDQAWSAPIWADCTTDLAATPFLRQPLNEATVSTFTPTFVWHPSAGAASYVLECSPSGSFPDDPTTVTVEGIVDTTVRLPVGLAEGSGYSWRVAAVNAHGTSAFSCVRTFSIGEVPFFSNDTAVELTTDPADDTCPSLAQAQETAWLVWSSSRDGDPELYCKTSGDCGESGSDAWRLTQHPGADVRPAVTGDPAGGAWVFWQSSRDGDDEIYATRHDGWTWTAPVNLSQHGDADRGPSATVGADGLLRVVWASNRDDRNPEIYGTTFDGEDWTPTERLTDHGAMDMQPVVVDVDGQELWLVWVSDRDGDREIYTKSFAGGSWSEDVRLTSTAGAEANPSVARTDDGRIWLAYARGGAVFYRIWEGGLWLPETRLPTQISFGQASVDWPAVVQACDGRVHIAYHSADSGSWNIFLQRSNYLSTGVAEPVEHAAPSFTLSQNVPNPFNPTTLIEYGLREPATVDLAIYDVAGRLVKRLVAADARGAGRHVVPWHGRDEGGRRVTSGVYLARLEVAGEVATRKMLLLK